jgi:SdpI/YfhL protein family
MNPAQLQALVMAGVIELILAAMSVLAVANWRRAAGDGLERNAYLGIRTPSTMHNEQSWIAGNSAATHTAPLYLLFNAATSAGFFAAAWHGWRLVVAFLGGAGLFAFIGLLIYSAVIATRAGMAAGGPTDHRSELRQSFDVLDTSELFSGRAMTVVGWICAVVACGVTVYMLGSIIDGYVLAIHQHLQPNTTFGFRDATAFSCLPRWYAAQKAGFSWLLFGYGPVLVASLLICVAAAIKRYSPWEICGLVLGTILLLIVFLVPAGMHADGVARAITC